MQLTNMIDTQQQLIHQTKYSRWNINNCGAGTLVQEKRYMNINVHTLIQNSDCKLEKIFLRRPYRAPILGNTCIRVEWPMAN
jgi:hypothetical protein